MTLAPPHHIFSYAEYLEREQATGMRHELLNGQVFAMAGGTPEHARLIAEIGYALRAMLDPRRWRLFSSDLKVRVAETGLVTYPDAVIVCGDVQTDVDPNAVTNPRLVVEVLSPGTEAYDRGEKWAHYRRIPSLDAYVLVSQLVPRLEVYERQPDRSFVHRVAEAGGSLPIACLGGAVNLDAIYAAAI